MPDRISEGRQAAFYAGTALMVFGFLIFGSIFVSSAMNFGNFTNFEGQARSFAIRGIVGMGMMILGGVIRMIGALGPAGAGVILNPDRARHDVKPYSRMAGGMIKDVLNEADVNLGGRAPQTIVKIKCTKCGKLNEEDSKFCQECGTRFLSP